jgi:hypothetical protein
MKKLIKYSITVILFAGLTANAQQNEIEADIFLNETMLKTISTNVKFNQSIDYTKGSYLMLASSNQFYVLGLGGIGAVFERTKNPIDAFSVATSDSLLLFVSNKSLFQIDTLGKFVKFRIPIPAPLEINKIVYLA